MGSGFKVISPNVPFYIQQILLHNYYTIRLVSSATPYQHLSASKFIYLWILFVASQMLLIPPLSQTNLIIVSSIYEPGPQISRVAPLA
jgi:hypothetical protein